MPVTREALEARLNDLDREVRTAALNELAAQAASGTIELPEPGTAVNVHAHTFYSFNGYGYSPSYLAWRARCEGLAVVGIVDFDVLDAVDEFLAACETVGIRGTAGLETRIFMPTFADREINSPGEPGISYFMGAGFVTTAAQDPAFLDDLKATAQRRNRQVIERINPHLDPVTLDLEADVLTLTPGGNPTERHLCVAYEAAAKKRFPDNGDRAAYWSGKLGEEAASVLELMANPPGFQALIRSKLMKAGGVGYVQPEGPDFPKLEEVCAFILRENAIPTATWLDGLSAGEKAIDEMLDTMMEAGVAALNVIPDRNWNLKDPDVKAKKVAELHRIVEIARERDLPLLVGTEMNAHGQRFVDDFDAPEMAPVAGPALEGAQILHGHTLLQFHQGMGYVSAWANRQFNTVSLKNAFYRRIGEDLLPGDARAKLESVSPEMRPNEILEALSPG